MDPIPEVETAQPFGGRATTKAFTEAKTTPVILVCIYNKNSTLITHDLLYNVFSAYGKIVKILIFEKVKVWKAFIEFSSVDEAVEAKRMLNDFQIFSDGTRINVYFSNLESVKFQNNNSGGIDYTQTGAPNLSDFKAEFPIPVPESTGNVQPEMTPTYQNQFANENQTFDQFVDQFAASTSTNSQSQPNSVKWQAQEAEEQGDSKFSGQGQHYDQIRDRDIPRYDQGPRPDNEEPEEGHFIHQFLNDAFPSSWNQELNYQKRKTQALQLNSPAFNDPTQAMKKQQQQQQQHQYMQNPPNQQYWQQGAPNPGPHNPHNIQNNPPPMDSNAPPGLHSFYPGQNKPSMQESRPMPMQGDRMIRMTGSLTNIPLRQNQPGPSQLSRGATYNDLPTTSPMNAGPMNPGMIPRYATFNELPKTSALLKPNLPHFGSVTTLPNTSNLGGFGMGGMGQGLGMNQQMHQGPPQLNKPMLNSRFGSTPELPLMSEISKFKLDSMSSQSIRDLIERDILLRLMMNQIQSNDNELLQQNLNVINDLNDIKKFSPALQGLGNIDYNNLAQMNKGTLDNIYQELTSLLGKSVENNKECAVLYVKGLEHKDIKVRMLYNIFSNFGNIKKIIFIRRQAAALIEYETVEYAAKAKDDLSNIVFMGKPLRIYYSFHPIINLKNKKNGKDASEEIFIGTPKTFRFGKSKNISMNPPSNTLHISNLPKEVCNEETMRNFFGPYGRLEAMQIKCMENNRNMCLIRMASLEESLNAMSILHDVDLGGRPVQISFTKSKI